MYSIKYIPLISILVFTLASCVGGVRDISCEDDPRCIIYGITSDILILDPHVSDSIESGIIFRQLYDTLIYRDKSGSFVPGLAQSWEISEDGLEYTFFLRDDVVFHDGTPFNSQSVAISIDRIFDPNLNSQNARLLLGAFSRYEILDDFTIRFYLFEPYIPLLDGLSQPYLGIVSPQSVAEYSPLRYQYHQVGTGPYRLDKYLPGERIEMSRNPNYGWAPQIYTFPDGIIIERIEFKIISDTSLNTELLIDGEVDIVDEVPPPDARNLSNNSELFVLPVDIPGQSVVFYFNMLQEHTDNPIVRRALLHATNRIAISDKVYLNFSPVAWAPLSGSTQYSHTGYINQFPFDLNESIALLESAGYVDTDGDGFLELNGSKLELDMLIPPWGQLPQVGDFLREQWRAIGVDLIINPIPGFNSLSNRIQSGDYNLISFDVFGIDPSLLTPIFASNANNNVIGYSNERLDDLIRQATQERDEFTRRSQYFQIQSIIMDETLILPIRDYVNIVASRSWISNLQFDAYGWYPLLYDARININ